MVEGSKDDRWYSCCYRRRSQRENVANNVSKHGGPGSNNTPQNSNTINNQGGQGIIAGGDVKADVHREDNKISSDISAGASTALTKDRQYKPVNEGTKRALQRCLTQLCECMQTIELLVQMRSKNVFTDFEDQKIEAKSTQYEKNEVFITLLKAKNQKAFDTFITCLWNTGQQHLATEVLDKLDDRAYAAELLTNCQSQDQDANTTQERDIKKLQKALKDMYLDRFKKVNPFSLPFTFDIENTWVSLVLRGGHLHATEDHAELLNNAFEVEKMLIIEGKPATGKTSLMRRLAYEWAKGENKLFHYDLVLYAEFREVREKEFETIADLVLKYNETFMESEVFNELSTLLLNRKYCESQRILLLLDGYDESSLDNQCKELNTYITSTTRRKKLVFNIVITTRPGYLGEHRGKQGRYTFADVLGFTTEKQKEKYISNHFASQSEIKGQESIAAVYKLLEENENVSKLAETPLFLTFICLVHERLENGTILELYCNVIWWMINRHQADNPDRDVPNLFEFYEGSSDKFRTIQDNYLRFPQLRNLGKMAFNNLKKDVFDESSCEEYKLKEIIQQVGLLRKDKFYDKSFNLTTTISFPHRTIQEFLAALFCFCSHEKLYHGFKSGCTTLHMAEYEKFLLRIALSDEIPVNEETRKHYFDVIEHLTLAESCDAFHTSNGTKLKLLNRLLKQCNNIFSLYMHGCTFDANSQLSFSNCSVLKELRLLDCIIHCGTTLGIAQLNTVEISDCKINMEIWLYIIEEIRKSSIKCLDLSFRGKHFNNEYINQLQNCNNIINEMTIKEYTIRSNDFFSFCGIDLHSLTFYECDFEANSQLCFINSASVKILRLVHCFIERGTALGIVQLKAIDTLEFESCIIALEDWKSITEEIRNSSVKSLNVLFYGNEFNNEYINQLQNCNNCIITMKFYDYTFRSNDLLSFCGIDLHSLTFHGCSFQADYLLFFTNCPAIDVLEFDDCNIDLKVWKSITEEIRSSSVRCLKLTPHVSKYLEFVLECNKIAEIYLKNTYKHPLQDSEHDIVSEMIKLARNMQNLKRIIFDFSEQEGELKDSNKELIEKAGQERDHTFTVTIISQ